MMGLVRADLDRDQFRTETTAPQHHLVFARLNVCINGTRNCGPRDHHPIDAAKFEKGIRHRHITFIADVTYEHLKVALYEEDGSKGLDFWCLFRCRQPGAAATLMISDFDRSACGRNHIQPCLRPTIVTTGKANATMTLSGCALSPAGVSTIHIGESLMFPFRHRAGLVILVTALVGNPVAADDSVDKVDQKLLELLQGQWKSVSSTFNGKKNDIDQGSSMVIDGRKLSIRLQDKVVGTLEIKHLVARESLGHIDFELRQPGKTVRVKQLFKLEGDTLTTCGKPPGATRPTDLASGVGSGNLLTVSQRTTKKVTTGQTQPAGDDPKSLKQQLAQIKADYSTMQNAASQKVVSIKEPAKREAAISAYMEELNRKGAPLLEQAFSLIRPLAAAPESAAELAWIIQNSPGAATANQAAELLVKHHLTSPTTLELASRFVYAPMAWTKGLLQKLAEADLSKEQKGKVLVQLAECIKTESSIPHLFGHLDGQMLKTMEMRFGKQYLATLRSADAAKLEQEAIRRFRDAGQRFGDVAYGRKTIADYAESAVFELEHLGISKVAPEIEGKDIDGVEFKLSDYRGKVVLLDFWGHW